MFLDVTVPMSLATNLVLFQEVISDQILSNTVQWDGHCDDPASVVSVCVAPVDQKCLNEAHHVLSVDR